MPFVGSAAINIEDIIEKPCYLALLPNIRPLKNRHPVKKLAAKKRAVTSGIGAYTRGNSCHINLYNVPELSIKYGVKPLTIYQQKTYLTQSSDVRIKESVRTLV